MKTRHKIDVSVLVYDTSHSCVRQNGVLKIFNQKCWEETEQGDYTATTPIDEVDEKETKNTANILRNTDTRFIVLLVFINPILCDDFLLGLVISVVFRFA